MKNKLIKFMSAGIIFFSMSSASAQIYVKVRPVVPVVVVTARPGPQHVWVDEEWESNNGAYTYGGGHWEGPPHHGNSWRKGYWKRHNNDGEVWVHGRWE